MSEHLGPGKLPSDLLAALLDQYGARSRRVLTPPALGEDAAAILTSLPCTVVATDPVTAPAARIGHDVVHRNANDVATRGAEPSWFLFTLLLPPADATPEAVSEIFRQVDEACRAVGAELIGGHTEITDAVRHPIAIGTMIGEITTFRLTATRNARSGNAIIMVGACGEHGTGMLATRHGEALRQRGVPDDLLKRAARFAETPRLSVVAAARIAMSAAHPHAMHDPTEGGLAVCLHEIAKAAQVGMEIDDEQVLVRPETREICARAELDPWGLESSGSLLVCVDAVDAEHLLAAYTREGIEARRIGTVRPADFGLQRRRPVTEHLAVPHFSRDEQARFEASLGDDGA